MDHDGPAKAGLHIDGQSWRPASAGPSGDDDQRARVHAWVDEVMKDTDAFFTPAPTTRVHAGAAHRGRARGRRGGHVDVSERVHHAAPREQPGAGALLSPPTRSASPGRARRPAVARSSCLRSGTPTAKATSACASCWRSSASRRCASACRITTSACLPSSTRADYIVSANIVRTLQVCRQAVMDVRRALWWLRDQGYDHLGLLGTSLGSCLSLLTTCHEPLVRAQALNHVSPYFGDVVWRGLSTEHVRKGLDGHVDLEELRDALASDQPVVVPGSGARQGNAARLREVRPDVPGGLVAEVDRRVSPARGPHQGGDAALRPLHDGRRRRSSISTGGIWGSSWGRSCRMDWV